MCARVCAQVCVRVRPALASSGECARHAGTRGFTIALNSFFLCKSTNLKSMNVFIPLRKREAALC